MIPLITGAAGMLGGGGGGSPSLSLSDETNFGDQRIGAANITSGNSAGALAGTPPVNLAIVAGLLGLIAIFFMTTRKRKRRR